MVRWEDKGIVDKIFREKDLRNNRKDNFQACLSHKYLSIFLLAYLFDNQERIPKIIFLGLNFHISWWILMFWPVASSVSLYLAW